MVLAAIEQTQRKASVNYMPQPDITLHELAVCLGVLLAILSRGAGEAERIVTAQPESCQRHFEIKVIEEPQP